MDAHDALHRHGEHAEGISLAQIGLGGEREAPQIVEALAVVRLDAGGVEFAPVVRHLLVGVAQRPLQALELQPRELLARRLLDRLELEGAHTTELICGSVRTL